MIAAPNRPEPRERPDRDEWLANVESPDSVDKLVRELIQLGVETAYGYRGFHDHAFSAVRGGSFEGGSRNPRTSHSDPTEGAVLQAQREAAKKSRENLLGAVRQLNEAKRKLEFARGRFEPDAQLGWNKRYAFFPKADFDASVAALARRRERGEI